MKALKMMFLFYTEKEVHIKPNGTPMFIVALLTMAKCGSHPSVH